VKFRSQEVALLVVPAGKVQVALEAARVLSIVPERTWEGAPPLDLLAATVGGEAPRDSDPRVLLLARDNRPALPIKTGGILHMQKVARDAMLPLPELLARFVPWLSSVVADGKTPLLVVDCARLGGSS
jgi:hypothetical protein